MKILCVLHGTPAATPEKINALLDAEVLHLWQSYAQDVIREFYFRGDRPGAIVVLECPSVEAASAHIAEFPLVKEGLAQPEIIPLTPFVGLARMFAKAPESAH